MKKTALLMALVILVCSFCPCVMAEGRLSPRDVWAAHFADPEAYGLDRDASHGMPVFVFPDSLISVEEEAFEGTAAVAVYLPDGMKEIGQSAFAGMPRLAFVYIPDSVLRIAGDAFAGVKGMTVFGVSGSYAQSWAQEHGYRFVSLDLWPAHPGGGKKWRLSAVPIQTNNDDQNNLKSVILHNRDGGGLLRDPKQNPDMYPVDYDFP